MRALTQIQSQQIFRALLAVAMRYKPVRALTHCLPTQCWRRIYILVAMRYKPVRALTQRLTSPVKLQYITVAMRYKPVRALTPSQVQRTLHTCLRSNEV